MQAVSLRDRSRKSSRCGEDFGLFLPQPPQGQRQWNDEHAKRPFQHLNTGLGRDLRIAGQDNRRQRIARQAAYGAITAEDAHASATAKLSLLR